MIEYLSNAKKFSLIFLTLLGVSALFGIIELTILFGGLTFGQAMVNLWPNLFADTHLKEISDKV